MSLFGLLPSYCVPFHCHEKRLFESHISIVPFTEFSKGHQYSMGCHERLPFHRGRNGKATVLEPTKGFGGSRSRALSGCSYAKGRGFLFRERKRRKRDGRLARRGWRGRRRRRQQRREHLTNAGKECCNVGLGQRRHFATLWPNPATHKSSPRVERRLFGDKNSTETSSNIATLSSKEARSCNRTIFWARRVNLHTGQIHRV